MGFETKSWMESRIQGSSRADESAHATPVTGAGEKSPRPPAAKIYVDAFIKIGQQINDAQTHYQWLLENSNATIQEILTRAQVPAQSWTRRHENVPVPWRHPVWIPGWEWDLKLTWKR